MNKKHKKLIHEGKYMSIETTKLSKEGQVTIPAVLREKYF